MSRRIVHIVGARPNFVKVAPVYRRIGGTIIHTGQHYDDNMSLDLQKQLGCVPHINCHATTMPEMVCSLSKTLHELNPQMILVYGDTYSTLAGALAARNGNVLLVHVEAGLRSGDWKMPEESNRFTVDHMSDFLLTHCEDGNTNLKRERVWGVIKNVGNVMIDSLVAWLPFAPRPDVQGDYALLTLHRPSNVDSVEHADSIVSALRPYNVPFPVFFPKHPRTKTHNLPKNFIELPPQSYLRFLGLQKYAKFVVTDSGGVQEETSYLGVPCLTVRDNTERPITVELGTNKLVKPNDLNYEIRAILKGMGKTGQPIPLWDGHAADRIAEVLGVN